MNSTVIDRGDFARVAYESIKDGVRAGTLKYREMFFNPTLHTIRGVPMATVLDGLIDGCHAAEADLGVRCLLIADVYWQDPPAMARQMVEELLEVRRPELIGLGMDAAEGPRPAREVRGGLPARRPSRSPPHQPRVRGRSRRNITTCLDLLGCERIDDGCHILEDEAVVARCRDEGNTFTCCPTSTTVVYGWPDLTTHPINGMIAAGLR